MSDRPKDFGLLQAFVRQADQAAFAQLARRHVDLVYATAFRKLQDEGAAQEVAQNVFGALARKAWQFAADDSLPAWLYKTALLESTQWLRGELRRRRREQTAAELGTTMKTPEDQPALHALVPLLDEALLSLREKDRAALLLRFYENLSLRELGTSLGVGEDAAQKRVASALSKLTSFFQRRGFKTATLAATAAALRQTATSAPAGVINAVGLAAGQMAPPALLGLAAVAARLGSWTKIQTAAACLVVAIVPVAWQWSEQHRARSETFRIEHELAGAQSEFTTLQTRIDRLNRQAERFESSIAAASESTQKRSDEAAKLEAWKTRMRSLLTASDYRWPEDSAFVRIPKSVVGQLEVRQPVALPGELKPEARELLGLSPEERQRIESALQSHLTSLNQLIENNVYETNQAAHLSIPSSAIASQFWSIPPLGEEVKKRGDALQVALQDVLGKERWPLVKELLDSSGMGTLRQMLNLDADKQGQEIGAWLQSHDGTVTAGYGWAAFNCSSSMSGAVPSQVAKDLSTHGIPDTVANQIVEWLGQNAPKPTGKEVAQ